MLQTEKPRQLRWGNHRVSHIGALHIDGGIIADLPSYIHDCSDLILLIYRVILLYTILRKKMSSVISCVSKCVPILVVYFWLSYSKNKTGDIFITQCINIVSMTSEISVISWYLITFFGLLERLPAVFSWLWLTTMQISPLHLTLCQKSLTLEQVPPSRPPNFQNIMFTSLVTEEQTDASMNLLLLVCVSLTIIGQPWNNIFICRV